MFGKAAKSATKTATTTRAGRKLTKAVAEDAIRMGRGFGKVANTRAGRGAGKAGVKGFGRLAKVAAKTRAGKGGAKGALKASRGFGKAALGKAALSGRGGGGGESSETRLIKYALFAVGGFAAGALLTRLGSSDGSESSNEDSSSFTESAAGTDYQSPEDQNRTGAERGYSDPSSGPLIGESHRTNVEGVSEEQSEAEQRIRTRIGEDQRASGLPHVNVEVADGVAELRGVAPSEETKEAAGEIAAEVEGVSEVRNLITVES